MNSSYITSGPGLLAMTSSESKEEGKDQNLTPDTMWESDKNTKHFKRLRKCPTTTLNE